MREDPHLHPTFNHTSTNLPRIFRLSVQVGLCELPSRGPPPKKASMERSG